MTVVSPSIDTFRLAHDHSADGCGDLGGAGPQCLVLSFMLAWVGHRTCEVT